MRRSILSLIALALMQSVVAQVPEVNSRVCAECGGNEQRKQGGEWVQISDHKSWCPIAKKIAEAEAAAWSPDFSSIEYQYGHGVKCEECGLVQGHVSDCLIGYNQKLALKHSDHTWSDPEAYKRKINIIEERIRHAAQRAREERAQAQQQRLGGSSQQNQSTKLKDHEPMPEQKPAETLIPEMAKMPRTELPNSTRVTNVQETSGPNDPTIYDKRIEFNDDPHKIQAVARCKTSQDGREEWTLFKKESGEKLAGPFNSLFVTDQDVYDFFIARDLNGLWGIYDEYGKLIIDHEYTDVEPLKNRDIIGKLAIKFACKRDGKWGMLDVYQKKFIFPCEYDDIFVFPEDPALLMLEKDGKRGLAKEYGLMEMPVQFTYIERMAIQKAGTYFIVSQDNVNYGAYYETFEKFPQQYTLGEIRQKIRDDASDFILRQQNQQKRKARGRNK